VSHGRMPRKGHGNEKTYHAFLFCIAYYH
jgi:hypothetical protein